MGFGLKSLGFSLRIEAVPYPDDLAFSRRVLFPIFGFNVNSGSGFGGGGSFTVAVFCPYADDDTLARSLFPSSMFKSYTERIGGWGEEIIIKINVSTVSSANAKGCTQV